MSLSVSLHQRNFTLQCIVVTTEIHDWSAYREWETLSRSTLNEGCVSPRPLLSRLRGHYRAERSQDPEILDICYEAVFAGHGSASSNAHRKSVPVAASYDLHQVKSARIPAWVDGSHEVWPLTEELLAMAGCWSSKNQFSSRMWSGRGFPLSNWWSCSSLCTHTGKHCVDSVYWKTKRMKSEGKSNLGMGVSWRGRAGTQHLMKHIKYI